ncbi:MAG: hypothetical protein ABW321_10890 [Polyangiales bacterium]
MPGSGHRQSWWWLIPEALTLAACSADGATPSDRGGSSAGKGANAPVAGASSTAYTPEAGTGNTGGRRAPGQLPPAAGSGNTSSGLPQPGGDNSCAAISQRATNERQPADIIFAVDNSGSMDEEIVFVREQLNAFSQQITDSGVDARIILISAPYGGQPAPSGGFFDDDDNEDNGICIAPPLGSGSCPEDSNPPRYFHVPEEVKSHDALNKFVDTFPQWRDQLRPNSNKTFVVITDDDADGDSDEGGGQAINTAAGFTEQVSALPGGLFSTWGFSGIYCFTECPEAAAVGTVYETLVQQTSGVKGDLCEQNFAPVFDALAKAVINAAGIACSWEIPPPPAGETFNRDQVNVQYSVLGGAPSSLLQVSSGAACASSDGWFYDDPAAPTRISVCPTTCDDVRADPQASVDVLFGCETLQAPE